MEKHLAPVGVAKGRMAMNYTVVIGKAPNNYCAFSPDVLGCISVADTYEEMRDMIREALEFHLEGMLLHGEAIPEPTARIETLEAGGHEYVVVFERGLKNYAAYVPDFLPECDEVTGDSLEEVGQKFRQAVADYLAAKERAEEPLPEPSAWAETMEIPHPSEVAA